eukprot:gene19542-26224_t
MSSGLGNSFVHALPKNNVSNETFMSIAAWFDDLSRMFENITHMYVYSANSVTLTYPVESTSIMDTFDAYTAPETFDIVYAESIQSIIMMLVYKLGNGGHLVSGIRFDDAVLDWLRRALSPYTFQYSLRVNVDGSSAKLLASDKYDDGLAGSCDLTSRNGVLVLYGHTFLSQDIASVVPIMIVMLLLCVAIPVMIHFMLVSRHQYQEVVAQFIPRHMIKRVLRGEKIQERYKNVSVLFSDIVSFTTLSQQVRGEDQANMLDHMYKRFDELAEVHKVYKTDIIGDAFMCMSNCPYTEDMADSVKRIVEFGLDMIDAVREIPAPIGATSNLQIRVGVHTGNVVSCVLGHRVPHIYPFGESVNYASRMESHGVPGELNVSGETYAILNGSYNDHYDFTPRDTINVKGYGERNAFLVRRKGAPVHALEVVLE